MSKEVYIIGGGTSLKGFDFSKLANKDTIVINQAVFHVPNPTYFITMDYIFYKKRLRDTALQHKFRDIQCTKIFVANMACEGLKEEDGRIIDTRWKLIYDLRPYDVIIKSNMVEGIGLNFKNFKNGENSGHCALQFALLMNYDKIHLLGLDFVVGRNKTHFHEGYRLGRHSFNLKLGKYYTRFAHAIRLITYLKPEIEIYNYSKISHLYKILSNKNLGDI